jgi:beta-galactosidase
MVLLIAIAAGSLQLIRAENYTMPETNRVTFNFNPDWKFIRQNVTGASAVTFDDSAWQTVSCPHTYNDTDTFDDWAVFPDGETDLWTGITWYRKHFTLDPAYAGRKVFVEFEAVRQIADVYINGVYLGQNKNGFLPFGFDLTPYLNFSGDNVVAVKCDNRFTNGLPWNDPHWHPAHGGIYRNVYLHVMDKLHVTLPLYSNLQTQGTYVYAQNVSAGSADVTVEAEVKNEYDTAKTAEFRADVVDNDGLVVLTLTDTRTLEPGSTVKFSRTGAVSAPKRWEPAYPCLYQVYTMVSVAGTPVDVYRTPLGIRSFHFDHDTGFWINDHRVKLHGWGQKPTNTWAGLGNAFPDWMHDYTIRMMKEAGGNFIRWGHCAGAPADIAAADKYGLITLQPGVDGESDCGEPAWTVRANAFRDMIIYYRNHPAIMIYEGGNQKVTDAHAAQLKSIMTTWDPHGGRAYAHRRADSVTGAYMEVSVGTEGSHECSWLPVVEGEYNREEAPRRVWDDYSPPDFDYVGGETQTYDLTSEQFAANQALHYKKISAASHCGGGNWIFSDTPSASRQTIEVARCSGEVDGVRLPKEAYYACQAIFRDDPRIHIIGHWTYPQGTVKPVYVMSNCERVELFVNGVSKGYGVRSNTYLFTFNSVAWESGAIRAVGYNGGVAAAEQQKQTAGTPYRVRLNPITGPGGLRADGSDVALVDAEVVDSAGNRCPTWQGRIDFAIAGPGVWRGGYNSGKIDSINHLYLDLECGVNRIAIRSSLTPGTITLTGTIPGLVSDTIAIQSNPAAISGGLWRELPATPAPEPLGTPPPPVTPQPSVTPPPTPTPAEKRLFTDFSYSGPGGGQVLTNAQNGKAVYSDSSLTFTDLPAYLAGGDYIQAANGDASYAAVDLMEFTAGMALDLYIAHDDREFPRPGWLTSAYADTGNQIRIGGHPYTLFKRSLAKGASVTLGQNFESAAGEGNLYVVFALEQRVISRNKTAVSSSAQAGKEAGLANDGDVATRWAAASGSYPQWWKIDLGGSFALTGTTIDWYTIASDPRAYRYRIEVSSDDLTYVPMADRTGNTAPGEISDSFSATARYVRITATGCTVSGKYAAANEIKIYWDGYLAPSVTPSPTPTPTAPPLLADDFNDGNADGWTAVSGTWTVSAGEYLQTDTSGYGISVAGNAAWTDYALRARIKNVASGDRNIGLIVRYQDSFNYYFACYERSVGVWRLYKRVGAKNTQLGTDYAQSWADNAYKQVALSAGGGSLVLSVGDTNLISVSDNTFPTGKIGLRTYLNGGAFDDLRVTAGSQ